MAITRLHVGAIAGREHRVPSACRNNLQRHLASDVPTEFGYPGNPILAPFFHLLRPQAA